MARRVLIYVILLVSNLTWGEEKTGYIHGEFLSIEAATKKWGVAPFSKSKFKNPDQRSTVVVDLIKSKKYDHAKLELLRSELGVPDGYFLDDTIPAYLLGSRKPGEKKHIWQIVFIPNEERTQVSEIRIHKNCCYQD